MKKQRGTLRTALAVVMAVTGAVVLPASQASQASAGGAPAAAERHDDFNGDGYSDLAVAAPEATVDGKTKAGYVAVVYGSATGLKTSSKQVVSQNSPGVTDSAETADLFGSAVSTADLDQDGYDDLIVGVTGEDSVEGGAETGLVQVVWGGPNGLSGGAALAYGHDTYDRLSDRGRLTVGDVNGDGAPDLVAVESTFKLRVIKGPFGRDGSARGHAAWAIGVRLSRWLVATGIRSASEPMGPPLPWETIAVGSARSAGGVTLPPSPPATFTRSVSPTTDAPLRSGTSRRALATSVLGGTLRQWRLGATTRSASPRPAGSWPRAATTAASAT